MFVVVVVVRLAFVLKTAEECVENRVEYVPKPAVGWCHYCSFRAFQEQSCNPIGRNSARSVSVPGLPKGKVSTRGFAMCMHDSIRRLFRVTPLVLAGFIFEFKNSISVGLFGQKTPTNSSDNTYSTVD
jgi:hypothetical protein